jgi:hypothetical protein
MCTRIRWDLPYAGLGRLICPSLQHNRVVAPGVVQVAHARLTLLPDLRPSECGVQMEYLVEEGS